MQKELLYRFFEGTSSLKEEEELKRWLEKSETNQAIFLQERTEYDIQLLNGEKTVEETYRRNRSVAWVKRVAAILILTLLTGSIYRYFTKEPEMHYCTLRVPPGQRINLVLPDSTDVWLNANTEFRYPVQFASGNRTVYLDGEAFFDVSKDKKNPFIVKTQQGDVRVTGTTFNVEAYSRHQTFEAGLFEGSIDIYKEGKKLATLRPNERGTMHAGYLTISQITDTDNYLWRKGLIAFKEKKIEEIFIALEKYFDVEIHGEMEHLPQNTYTGKFRQSDGIDYVLRVLQRSILFSYERNEENGAFYIQSTFNPKEKKPMRK